MFQLWYQFSLIFRLSKHYGPYWHSVDTVFDKIKQIYNKKLIEFKKSELEKENMEKNIFIDRIIKIKSEDDSWSDKDVIYELNNVVNAVSLIVSQNYAFTLTHLLALLMSVATYTSVILLMFLVIF